MQVLPQLDSLNRVVLDLVGFYEPAFALKRLGSGLDLDPALPLAWIDTPQLERGLANVLRSTVKYTRNGDLVFCRTAARGDWVQLTIGDNGPPISGERAAALSAPMDDEPIDEDSVGRGLYASRAIVAAHGGEISIDTSHGTGAWFVVRLPAIAPENAQLLKELERGDRLMYDLVATLSYELRTPLNAVMGYNDLLLDGAFGSLVPTQVEILHRVSRSAHELRDLINATLDLGGYAVGDDKERGGTGVGLRALESTQLVEQVQKARRFKAEFVSTTSHQLRIPLNVISGYNDLLLDGEFGTLSAEQVRVLRRVRKSTLELLDAINSNLDLSRLDREMTDVD